MKSPVKIAIFAVIFCYMTCVGWTWNMFGMLENPINCWLLKLDTPGSSYSTFCKNASTRFKNGDYDGYKIQWAFINQAQIAGLVLGSFLFPLVDRFGRKRTLLGGAIAGVVGSVVRILGFYWDSYAMVIAGAFPAGAATGIGMMVVPMYTMEIVPTHLSTSFGPSAVFGICVGQLFCAILGQEWMLGATDRWLWFMVANTIGYLIFIAMYSLCRAHIDTCMQGD